MTEAEARFLILELFERKDDWGYCEILSETGIDLELAVEVCDKLKDEGILAIAADFYNNNPWGGRSSTQHNVWVMI